MLYLDVVTGWSLIAGAIFRCRYWLVVDRRCYYLDVVTGWSLIAGAIFRCVTCGETYSARLRLQILLTVHLRESSVPYLFFYRSDLRLCQYSLPILLTCCLVKLGERDFCPTVSNPPFFFGLKFEFIPDNPTIKGQKRQIVNGKGNGTTFKFGAKQEN